MTKPNQSDWKESSPRRDARIWLRAGGLGALLTVAACTGAVGSGAPSGAAGQSSTGSSGASGLGNGGSGGTGITHTMCVQGASLAPARLSLITDEQYRNIVKDVFGVTVPDTFAVSTQSSPNGAYPFNENAQLVATTLQEYLRAADLVASLLTSMPPCTMGAVNATCMQTFLMNQLPRAWRRPVASDEMTGLISIFNSGAPDGQARQIQLTMEAALIHPAFLYRTELGTNAGTLTSGKVQLTPHELASAVSFATLNSAPDPELWSKAEDGTLAQATVLDAQVTRLMGLPEAQANLTKKTSYYLNFEMLLLASKDPKVFPAYASLQPTLYQSAQMLLNDLLWSGSGHFDDLFTSRKIYTNAAMSTAYGLPPVTGSQLQPVTTTGDMYNAGLLTHPALIAASNKLPGNDDVIHRGLWAYYNLTCAPPLPLPSAAALAIGATLTGKPTRYQAQFRDGPPIPDGMGGTVAGSGCATGCHGRFDPFGLVTMNYDGMGRYRTTDPSTVPPNGPVDATANIPVGVLTGVAANMMVDSTPFVHVNGVSDMAQYFTSGRQASDCAATTLATYTLDHSPDVEGSCDMQTLKDNFKKSGSVSDLFASILKSPAFLTRDIENP